jgi:antitoxin (DNA-binding transcriptional repressor) of toxin-antitoxin stability system
MKAIRIAELKRQLSKHLRSVRAGGSLTVLDRDTPIARIVPWQEGDPLLKVRAPIAGAPRLHRVRLPVALALDRDIVELLIGERQGER